MKIEGQYVELAPDMEPWIMDMGWYVGTINRSLSTGVRRVDKPVYAQAWLHDTCVQRWHERHSKKQYSNAGHTRGQCEHTQRWLRNQHLRQ